MCSPVHARLNTVSVGVEHQDVIKTLIGAAGGLAGLVLVFFGLVVGAYGSLPGDTPAAVRTPLRRSAFVLLFPFGLGIACLAAGAVWLLVAPGWTWLYVAVVALFFALLAGLVAASLWIMRTLLWA